MYGEGWETEKAAIQAAIGHTPIVTEAAEQHETVGGVDRLAGMLRLSKRASGPVLESARLYIQRPEAELKYEQSGGISPVARRQEKVARKLKSRLDRRRTRTRRKA